MTITISTWIQSIFVTIAVVGVICFKPCESQSQIPVLKPSDGSDMIVEGQITPIGLFCLLPDYNSTESFNVIIQQQPVDGDTPVVWMQNGNLTNGDDGRAEAQQISEDSYVGYQLVFYDVKRSLAGDYSCLVFQDGQLIGVDSTYIDILYLPRLLLDTNIVQEDQNVSLRCLLPEVEDDDLVLIQQTTVTGAVVTWMVDGFIISEQKEGNPNASVTENRGIVEHVLTFNAMQRVNAGIYSCQVYRMGSLFGTDSIDVFYYPQDRVPDCVHTGGLTLNLGDVIELLCASQDEYPSATLQWLQDSSPTELTQTVVIVNGTVQNKIVMTAAEEHDGMTFTCNLQSTLFPSDDNDEASCSVGPFSVGRTVDIPDAILGIPFPIFVISAAGIGTFILLSILCCPILFCHMYRCACVVSRKSYTISGISGHYDLSRNRAGSTKETTDVWTEKRPSRVAPPPPVHVNRKPDSGDINHGYVSNEVPLEGHQVPVDPPESHAIPMDYPPPPEEWLSDTLVVDDELSYFESEPSVHYHSDSGTIDKKHKGDGTLDPNGHDGSLSVLSSEWSDDIISEDETQNESIPLNAMETIYQNSPNVVKKHTPEESDQDDSKAIVQKESHKPEEVYQNSQNVVKKQTPQTPDVIPTKPSSTDQNSTSPVPNDLNGHVPLSTRGSKTLPRASTRNEDEDFPIYAKPDKSELKRSSSWSSRDKRKSERLSKPTFQPPLPPPPPPSNSEVTTQDSDPLV